MGKSIACYTSLISIGTKKRFLFKSSFSSYPKPASVSQYYGLGISHTNEQGRAVSVLVGCRQRSTGSIPARPSTLENGKKLMRAAAVRGPPAGVRGHVAFAMVSGKHAPFVELLWFKYCARQSSQFSHILNKEQMQFPCWWLSAVNTRI